MNFVPKWGKKPGSMELETSQPKSPRPPRAIVLLSGGLDSVLAAKIVKDEGVEVIGLHLVSPFGCENEVKKCADQLGIDLLFRDKGEAYLDLVEGPKYGYGKAMNPCIDCRIYMFKLAEKVMNETGAQFVITGEVLGQRPMSQQKNSLNTIDRNSPLFGRVLRPLSAKLLEPTIAEESGWVKRENMLGISGRGRKDQLALAQSLGLTFFAAPSGGCLLTEVAFGNRLRDLIGHKTHQTSEERIAQSAMLRLGRHFRLSENAKVIVCRNEKENQEIEKLWSNSGGLLFIPGNFDGPSAVAFGDVNDDHRATIAGIMARYGKGKELKSREVVIRENGGEFPLQVTREITEETLERMRL
jgi:tRNA-uridine 2-sulfurtransferase